MSIPNPENVQTFCQKVIVRGYADEPTVLNAARRVGDRVEVFGSDESRPIDLPSEYVFQHDPSLFERLSRAFRRNDGQLASAWKHAKPFVES